MAGSIGLSSLLKHTSRGHLAKSWAQRINLDGRQRNLGLGSWPHRVPLVAQDAASMMKADLIHRAMEATASAPAAAAAR